MNPIENIIRGYLGNREDSDSENSYNENASQLDENTRVSVIPDSVFNEQDDTLSNVSTNSINEGFME